MIIECRMPFTTLCNEYFLSFCLSLDPKYNPPDIKTIKKQLDNTYNIYLNRIKILFEGINSKMPITTDIWTGSSKQSFLRVTAHFIDNEWSLRHIV